MRLRMLSALASAAIVAAACSSPAPAAKPTEAPSKPAATQPAAKPATSPAASPAASPVASPAASPAAGATTGGAAAAAPNPAAKIPERQITLINAYAPGGGTDIMFRNIDAISQKLKIFPQPFIIETKTGGSGTVGKAAALQARPDGTTLTVADDGNIYAELQGQQPFSYKDFTYIARMVIDYNMIIVRTESPYQTLKDFIEAARAKPRAINVAGTSIGSTDQVQLVQFQKKAGVEYNYTAFNSGGEVMTNLLGGHVDAAMANPSEAYEQMRAGKVRALGISAPERLKDLPDVPTWKESGVDLVVSQFRGIAGPKGLPPDVVAGLEEGFRRVAASNEWRTEYLDKFQQVDGFMGSKEFTAYMDQLYSEYEGLFKELGLYKKQ